MNRLLSLIPVLLLNASLVLAQDGAGAAGQVPPPPMGQRLAAMAPMFMIVFLIFWFLVLRPQSKQLRDHQNLLGSLKKGEQVATSGGLIGRVAGIEKEYILLDVATGVKIKVERAHISKRLETTGQEKSQEKKA